MSAKVMGLVWDHYPEGGGEMLTALKLADNAHDDGTHIFPSVKTVALLTYQSERTVQRHLRAMEHRGWLVLEEEAFGPGRARTYRIPIERVPQQVVTRVTKCHPSPVGVTSETKGVTRVTERGDTAMAPEPSLTVIEPSVRTANSNFEEPNPVIIELPTRTNQTFPIHQRTMVELEPLYPAVDVLQTLREMKGWLIGHPERRPRRRMMGFVTTWLKREQDEYGGQA